MTANKSVRAFRLILCGGSFGALIGVAACWGQYVTFSGGLAECSSTIVAIAVANLVCLCACTSAAFKALERGSEQPLPMASSRWTAVGLGLVLAATGLMSYVGYGRWL